MRHNSGGRPARLDPLAETVAYRSVPVSAGRRCATYGQTGGT
ncbi:hypothetical protein [Nocardia mexicana]|nr:hypothetical protein [Nocardia mexicana]